MRQSQQTLNRLRPWLLGAAALTLTLTCLPHAASAAEAGQVRTVIDGRLLTFDVAPVVQDNRTLVPMRGFLTALGATIGWDEESQTATATIGPTEVKATIGNSFALVNGNRVPMDIPPQMIHDRTMVPLRFFSENLGLTVTWEDATQTVYVDSRRMTLPSRDGGTANRTGVAILDAARKLVGSPYTWGGTNPLTGFDCSGMVTYLSKQFDLGLPRTSYEMFHSGVAVAKANLQAGDLVFFSTDDDGASHVGVYDGGGGFIHAQSAGTGVKVTSLSSPWWAVRYLGARRVVR